ncbi:MAG TPA: CbtB-domain containing protein [Stellaceae bacterium]|nr:CbtB-domain containing protein [Stellaceae bacterium]
MTDITTTVRRAASARVGGIAAPLLAILFGAFLVYGVGFAGSAAIHNAAHDVRHAFAFPCH